MRAQWRDSVERVKEPEALSVYSRAHDNLEFIRATMANSTSFTAVSGLGMAAMGLVALIGAYVATREDNFDRWIACWLVVAFAGCSTGVAAMAIKAHLLKVSLWHGSGRRFLLNFTPAVLAGAMLSEMYYGAQPAYSDGGHPFVAAIWLLLYGAAVISGGAHSVRPVWVMGVCFMLAGALIYLLPDAALAMPGTVRPYDVVLAVAFGGIHIIFGAVIAIRHGG